MQLCLDPACGEGALLVAVLDVWLERLAACGAERGSSRLVLCGIDVDAAALATARARLEERLTTASANGAAAPARVELRLVHADALARATHWPAGAVVVANPPWGSYSGRERLAPPAGRQPRAKGWPSLHGRFAERIAGYCARHATPAIVLMPAAWCDLDRYGPSRSRVDAHADLTRTNEPLGESAFPGVTSASTLVRLRSSSTAESAAPDPALESARRALLAASRPFPRWPSACFGDIGVHTGNAAAWLLERGATRELAAAGANLREGRDLGEYRLGAPRVRLRTNLEARAGLSYRTGTLGSAQAWSVLLRQTANRPIAAVHEPALWFRNSLLGCRPPEGVAPDAAVALLNGPLATAFHRASFADARQRAFPQVKIAHLRAQPFPFLTREQAPRLHDELAERAKALRQRDPRLDATGWTRDRDALAERSLCGFKLPEALHRAVLAACEGR
jgi:hypothetical protein